VAEAPRIDYQIRPSFAGVKRRGPAAAVASCHAGPSTICRGEKSRLDGLSHIVVLAPAATDGNATTPRPMAKRVRLAGSGTDETVGGVTNASRVEACQGVSSAWSRSACDAGWSYGGPSPPLVTMESTRKSGTSRPREALYYPVGLRRRREAHDWSGAANAAGSHREAP
jgi:hypothetical protein